MAKGPCILVLMALCVAPCVWAKKRNFKQAQRGVTLGAGVYNQHLRHYNRYEPVQGLAGPDYSFNGLTDTSIFPFRLGLFHSTQSTHAEVFFRYVHHQTNWEVLGDKPGIGQSTIKGRGAGVLLGMRVAGSDSFRIMLGGMAEYVQHKALIEHDPDAGATETLRLSSTNILVGPALMTEMWLGDLWSLSLLSAYEYGVGTTWRVSRSGELFGVQRGAGTARNNDRMANPIISEFGGFLTELTFKLSFY
jgi:hypothetical protein